jgi:hypothetical protein
VTFKLVIGSGQGAIKDQGEKHGAHVAPDAKHLRLAGKPGLAAQIKTANGSHGRAVGRLALIDAARKLPAA